ncbi:hypothetical protein [Runella sp.]|uniref:hypothetical protein n=1 Tax=Runella sp. TaxID=1960881 RepID=UPI00301663D5
MSPYFSCRGGGPLAQEKYRNGEPSKEGPPVQSFRAQAQRAPRWTGIPPRKEVYIYY